MRKNPGPEGLISERQLDQLAEWFEVFEYADPSESQSTKTKEAKLNFEKLVNELYENPVFTSLGENLALTRSWITGTIRNECKKRVSAKTPKYTGI